MNDYWPVALTIDRVRVTEGLRVIDYNLDLGTVKSVDFVANNGIPWFNVALDKGGTSQMDGGRMWTRLNTNAGWLIAANHCRCGDLRCDCGCVIGTAPCEHGQRFKDRFTPEEWAERQRVIEEALDFEYGDAPVNPTAGEGCGS